MDTQRVRLASAGFAFAVTFFLPLPTLATPVRPGVCTACTTEAQLYARAQQVANAIVDDDHVKLFIASTTEPMAGFYEAQLVTVDPDPWYSGDEYLEWQVWHLTQGDDEAKLLDNTVFSRKLVFDLPSSVAATASDAAGDEGTQADINSWLITNHPVSLYMLMFHRIRIQSLPSEIFVHLQAGHVVTIKFADGSSAQFRWNGHVNFTTQWEYVTGSARGPDGQPYGQTLFPGGGGGSFDFFNGPDWFSIDVPMDACALRGTVCTPTGCVTRAQQC